MPENTPPADQTGSAAPNPDETIKIVEAPPEVTGVTPEFRQPTADELKEFPPPPPLVMPTEPTPDPAPQPTVAPVGIPLVMDDKSASAGVVVGTRTEPPKVVETRPTPPPPAPSFEDLPEKTKAEMRAGRTAIGGAAVSFEQAVEQQAPDAPRDAARPHDAEPRPGDAAVDLSQLPERTRLEIQAGRDLLARKRADYQAVVDKVAGDAAKRLEEGGPAKPSDLDYPRG